MKKVRTTASHASLRELADTYGTPLVVIDDETVRSRLRGMIRSDHHRLALDLRGGIALSMLRATVPDNSYAHCGHPEHLRLARTAGFDSAHLVWDSRASSRELSADLLDRGGEAILSALEFLDYSEKIGCPIDAQRCFWAFTLAEPTPSDVRFETYEKAIARYPGIGIYLDATDADATVLKCWIENIAERYGKECRLYLAGLNHDNSDAISATDDWASKVIIEPNIEHLRECARVLSRVTRICQGTGKRRLYCDLLIGHVPAADASTVSVSRLDSVLAHSSEGLDGLYAASCSEKPLISNINLDFLAFDTIAIMDFVGPSWFDQILRDPALHGWTAVVVGEDGHRIQRPTLDRVYLAATSFDWRHEQRIPLPSPPTPQALKTLGSAYLRHFAKEDSYDFIDVHAVGPASLAFSIDVQSQMDFVSVPLVQRIVNDATVMTTLWALGLETKDTPVWADRLEINNVAYVSANRIIRLVLDLSPFSERKTPGDRLCYATFDLDEGNVTGSLRLKLTLPQQELYA